MKKSRQIDKKKTRKRSVSTGAGLFASVEHLFLTFFIYYIIIVNDILRFTPVETIIFNNDFLWTINGQLGRRHSCVRDVVFNSSKIIFSDDIFNGMTTIEHIFVREEDFAKNLFERIPRQYKDKIFCLCEDDVNESIMFYRNNTYRLFKK